MTKSKRTAEDIVRLIHLERDPLPPSELAKISAWLNSETRKSRLKMMIAGSISLFLLALFVWCALVWLLELPRIWAVMIFGSYLGILYVGVMGCGHRRRAFLEGFVKGVRVSEPGAPKKWTIDVSKETIASVQAVAAETGMSIARSIEILKKRDPERWESLSEPRYYEAVRRLEKST